MAQTPASLGYRMPAEWEKHEATWLSWPKDPTTFPPGKLEDVEKIYLRMIEELSRGERVDLLVDDQKTQDAISSRLRSTNNVVFHQIRTADVWMRDYGPIFIKNATLAATKWVFNAWGNKYDDLKEDNNSGMKVAALVAKSIFEPRIVLEGGSIDVNGQGTCLTTRQCLLNKNRNPELDQMEIEERLREFLGITNVIWLDSGVAGDDTDGHVDDIARFVNHNTVLCMTEEDVEDDNYDALKA
ncbi:MAG: agmatine deiminase family protein, partial [Nitrososphaerota archaeon]|nr:agmatine deiminase family protein [Nitrososphaerota archaeon]